MGPTTAAAPDALRGLLAAPSKLRGAITPPPRQQGIEAEARPVSSRFDWERLLKRVFAIDMERCPRCQQGTLRIISALTYQPIIPRLLKGCRARRRAEVRPGRPTAAFPGHPSTSTELTRGKSGHEPARSLHDDTWEDSQEWALTYLSVRLRELNHPLVHRLQF